MKDLFDLILEQAEKEIEETQPESYPLPMSARLLKRKLMARKSGGKDESLHVPSVD